MKKTYMIVLLALASCTKTETDTQLPVISFEQADAFPRNCDTIYFGEPFRFTALLSDDQELGSYSIDIHHNFDHHSHATEVSECVQEPNKSPVRPVTFIQEISVPAGTREMSASHEIIIPAGDVMGKYDEGDYHFFVSLTDESGWSAKAGIAVKVLHR